MKKTRIVALGGVIFGLWGLAFGAFWHGTTALAATSPWDATVVSVSPGLTAKAGSTVSVEVVLKNTGTNTWANTGDNAVKLGTAKPRDGQGRMYHPSWLSPNRVVSSQESQVAPGATGRFVFNAVVAGGSGTLTEILSPVAEGIAWFGPEIKISINVLPANFKGELVSVTPTSLNLKTKDTATVRLQIKNTGDTAWDNAGAAAVKIGTVNPNDRKSNLKSPSWLSDNRVAVATTVVAPGEIGTFDFSVQAPGKTGTFKEDFGVVVEGIAWLPIKFTLTAKVDPAFWDGQWVAQSPAGPISISPGETAQLSVDIKNTGNTIWHATGDNPVKLGTSRALDRQSSFASSSWLSGNRAALVSPSDVNPGEVGRFSFSITAPDKIGKYREYFRPLAEYSTWMSDQGIYFDISVDEELVVQQPIRVGITSTTDSITISGDSFVIRRGTDKSLVRRVAGGSVTATGISGGYTLSSGETVMDYLRFVPQNGSILTVQTTGVSSSYNRFRGIIEVRISSLSGNRWVVNTLELEDYMKGIAEVPDGWPVEAQKAQMTAARTYAAAKLTAPVADIFDIYDDTRDQVYDGYNYEVARPNLAAAADATRGMVIKYQGAPIKAFFSSDSGGYTAANEDVWGGSPLPYLRPVPDPYAQNTPWSATLTQDYLKERFDDALGIAASSPDIITKIEVTAKDPSGRAKTVTFTMQSGKVVNVTGATFDYLTNNTSFKSMIFTIAPAGAPERPDFQFNGQGNGHGVGMPQYGAKNMALAGKTYQEILTYYYTGVSVQPL